ncbi:hypothetical protein AH02_9 [Pseudomonas phage AH02]|nr:hypothetical protein AH02_9 [Pseudomonas phage AH02]
MASQSLGLSAADVANFTGWPDAMVNDYISREPDYPLSGSGSPEGVQPANRTLQYFDKDSGKLYYNANIGSRTGWVAV